MITLESRSLPLLTKCDVLVLGGSMAAVAAARELADRGNKVVLVEHRTYLGWDMTGTLRPWLAASVNPAVEQLPPILQECEPRMAQSSSGDYWLFQTDVMRNHLEDGLLARDVTIIYASYPMHLWRPETDSQQYIVIGNKSGRQIIEAKTVITADYGSITERHLTPGPLSYQWTLEFLGVEGVFEEAPAFSAELGVGFEGVFQGPWSEGHAYVVCSVGLRDDETPAPDLHLIGTKAAAHLIEHDPRFSAARLVGLSLEFYRTPQRDSVITTPMTAQQVDLDPLEISIPDGHWQILASAFSTANPRVWRLDPYLVDTLLERSLRGNAQMQVLVGSALAAAVNGLSSNDDSNTYGMPTGDIRRSTMFASEHCSETYDALPKVDAPALPIGRTLKTEILVVGGGSSGAMAGATAAAEGADTVLVDMNPGLGGSGTFGGVDSYWYGRKVVFAQKVTERVEALRKELQHTGPKWSIEAKIAAWTDLALEAGVKLFLRTCVVAAVMDGSTIKGVIAVNEEGLVAIEADVVIDATGDGDVAAHAGAPFRYGSEHEGATMWYSLAQFKEPGKLGNNFTSMVRVDNILDYTRALLAGRRRGGSWDHGIYVAPRESRHVLGAVVLTLTDQLRQRQWPDTVNIHFSNHDIKGHTTSPWLRTSLIPPNLLVEIPYRALIPQGVEGLIMAGKAISADHDGLPTIRMQADLENLGGVVALATVEARQQGRHPRHLAIKPLQERLVQMGLLPEAVLAADRPVYPYSERDLQPLAAELTRQWPLYHYSDMDMTTVFEEPIPLVELCSRPEESIPLLQTAYDNASGRQRIPLAQALALMGSDYGRQALVDAVNEDLDASELPTVNPEIRHFTWPPDQGAMPETAYLLYSLGTLPHLENIKLWQRTMELLDTSPAALRDKYRGSFYFVDAICFGAERLGSPAALPVLRTLQNLDAFGNQTNNEPYEVDFFQEREAFLAITIARAMARCGARSGLETLVTYLADTRKPLAAYACSQLRLITESDGPCSTSHWQQYVASLPEELPSRPVRTGTGPGAMS